jgi:hypothetical protein
MNCHIIPKISENFYEYCDMKIYTIPSCFLIAQWRNGCCRIRDSFQILGYLSKCFVEVLVWMNTHHSTYCCDAHAGEFVSGLLFFMVHSKIFVVFFFSFLIKKTINYYSRLVVVCLYLYGHSMNAIGENGKVLNIEVRCQTFPQPNLYRNLKLLGNNSD